MTEHDVFAFWLALATVLAAARLLGKLARSRGLPTVLGEVAAGIALGPGGLGLVAPGAWGWLFRPGGTEALVSGTAAIAGGLLLAAAGFELDLRVLRRRGRRALLTAFLGLALPMATGAALGLGLPASTLVDPTRRWALAAVLGAALSVSALPFISSTLVDLGLLESDVGLLATAAATLDDLVTWAGLSLLLGPARGAQLFGGLAAKLGAERSARWKKRARAFVRDLGRGVCAPVFFGSLGLLVDFSRAFDLRLCAVVCLLATGSKLIGATMGARIGGMKWRQAAAVGFGMNARGGMGILVAELARRAGALTEPLFVALVVMALATSAVSAPVIQWLLYDREGEEDVVTLLRRGAFVSELSARTPSEAIGELVRALGSLLAGVKRRARDAVLERELVAATGLGDEIAIPHAAVEGLEHPLLALGRAPQGIDFDAPDGQPARFVFLLLIPPKAYKEEVRILASIARATFGSRARELLTRATGIEEVTRALSESARRTRESQRPARPPSR